MKFNKLITLAFLLCLSMTSAFGKKEEIGFDPIDSISSFLRMDSENDKISLIQNEISDRNTIVCIGNREYLQFINFVEAVDTSHVLGLLFEKNRLQIIDPDNIPDSFSNFVYYIKMLKYLPSFLVLDNEGALLIVDQGYQNEERLLAMAVLASMMPNAILNQYELLEKTEKQYKKWSRQSESYERWYKMVSGGHHVDLCIGYGLHSLSGKNENNNSGVLSADIGFRQGIGKNRRVSLGTGIAMDHVFDQSALTRLDIPIETELTVLNGYPIILCRAGIWGGRVFVKEQYRQDYCKYEAGVQCSMSLNFGNFDFSVGYKRGLTNLLSTDGLNGYSNLLSLSVRLRLFE